jgi:hypothetical protein
MRCRRAQTEKKEMENKNVRDSDNNQAIFHHVENNDNIEKYINLISTKIFLFRISEPYLVPRN